MSRYAYIFYSFNYLSYTSGTLPRGSFILSLECDLLVFIETKPQHLQVYVSPYMIFQTKKGMKVPGAEAGGLTFAEVIDHKSLEVRYHSLQFAHLFHCLQIFQRLFHHRIQSVDIWNADRSCHTVHLSTDSVHECCDEKEHICDMSNIFGFQHTTNEFAGEWPVQAVWTIVWRTVNKLPATRDSRWTDFNISLYACKTDFLLNRYCRLLCFGSLRISFPLPNLRNRHFFSPLAIQDRKLVPIQTQTADKCHASHWLTQKMLFQKQTVVQT